MMWDRVRKQRDEKLGEWFGEMLGLGENLLEV